MADFTDKTITSLNNADLIQVISRTGGDAERVITFENLQNDILEGLDESKLVTTDNTVTMTNKTITSPKIGTATEYVTLDVSSQTHASPSLTIPDLGDAADEIVTKDVQQTLTNKTITAPTLTLINTAVVNAVASTGVLNWTGVAANNETVTIGSGASEIVYTFKDALTAPETANEVLVEVSAQLCMENLMNAINKGAGGGTKYGSDTVAHSLVTGVNTTAAKLTITSKIKGVVGNASPYVTTTTIAANAAWTAALMGGVGCVAGVNGTVGVQDELRCDRVNHKLWLCEATNTIADANWVSFTKD